jgi:Putative sensor
MAMTATLPVTSAPARPVARGFGTRLLARSAYLLSGLPIAVVSFSLLVTGFAASVGTLVIVVGLVVIAATLAIARGFARIERARLDAVTGARLPGPAYKPLRPGFVGGVLSGGADPRRWLDLVHGIVVFPVALATFVLTVVWWSVALGGVTYGLWSWALPGPGSPDNQTLSELLGYDGRTADILLSTGIGVAALVTLPLVVAGCAAVQTGLGRALLGAWDD